MPGYSKMLPGIALGSIHRLRRIEVDGHAAQRVGVLQSPEKESPPNIFTTGQFIVHTFPK
jgi:hypothetical protein